MEIIETPWGPAHVHLDGPASPELLLMLTHGAGGGVDTPDLLAVRDSVVAAGGAVARVLQPFRVAGRKAPGSPKRQDEAWLAIAAELGKRYPRMVFGGRSNGARVACRTAREGGAEAVVALAFPLHAPGRPAGRATGKEGGKNTSRADELRGAGVDVLVINGERDPFGVPDAADAARLVVLPGEGHDLRKHPERVGEEVAAWLRGLTRR